MTDTTDSTHLTAEIVKAYVTQNKLSSSELPSPISSVHTALQGLGQPEPEPQTVLKPAVPIKKSVTPDFITSLEDGRQYKSLKRHLTGLGMTPQQYREKWGLPADYPVTAPNYAAKRSELARASGLGRKSKEAAAIVEAPEAVAETEQQTE